MGLYIFDIDGTLADLNHRLHYIQQENPDWPGFFKACQGDTPIKPVIQVLEDIMERGHEVWFFTGREEIVRDLTEEWLFENTSYVDSPLMMRPEGDYRPDDVIKQELLENMLEIDRQRLIAVFDDRQKVVDMWRRNGVPCFQVAPGDF